MTSISVCVTAIPSILSLEWLDSTLLYVASDTLHSYLCISFSDNKITHICRYIYLGIHTIRSITYHNILWLMFELRHISIDLDKATSEKKSIRAAYEIA